MFNKVSLAFLMASVAAPFVSASVILSDDFSGSSSTALNGLSTDVGSYVWSANAGFKADGSYSTTNALNDFGGSLDLGSGFFASQFGAGNTTVTLTLALDASSNAFTYLLFSDSATFNTASRAQSQGGTIGIEVDSITSGGVGTNLYRTGDTRTAVTTALPSPSDQLTLSIIAGVSGYSDSTVTLTAGAFSQTLTHFDISAMRRIIIGVESNGTSSADYGLISLQAVPETSIYGLLGAGTLAGIAFVRRRRKIS